MINSLPFTMHNSIIQWIQLDLPCLYKNYRLMMMFYGSRWTFDHLWCISVNKIGIISYLKEIQTNWITKHVSQLSINSGRDIGEVNAVKSSPVEKIWKIYKEYCNRASATWLLLNLFLRLIHIIRFLFSTKSLKHFSLLSPL